MISSMVVLAPHGEVTKTLPVVRLATEKLIVSIDAVVEVKLLATTLAGKHMATVLPNFVLARYLHRLESFVTYITGVNPLSLSCALSHHNDSIQQQDDFPHKPALDTCRSRCKQMSTSLFVLATVVALLWQTGKGGKWQVSWCLRRPQIVHDVGSVCISTMWLFNFFLGKRTLKQELQVKETRGKRDQGEFNQHAILRHQAVLRYTLPPRPLHLLLIIIILLLLHLILLQLLLLRRFGKPPGPPSSPAGTCRTGTNILLPQVSKY